MSQFEKAFSNAYISKQLDGNVSICFSIDFLQLFKELSDIPDVVFDNMAKVGDQMIKNVKIIDSEIKDYEISSGLFKYRLFFTVSGETKSRTLSDIERLSQSLTHIGKYLDEADKFESIDQETGEFTEQFIESSANGAYEELMKGIDILYDILEYKILNDFGIRSFKLQRFRVKNFISVEEVYDFLPTEVVLDTGTASEYFVDFENFQELTSPIEIDAGISIDRQEFKDSYNIRDAYSFKVLGLIQIIKNYQDSLLSFVRQGSTPSSLDRIAAGTLGDTTPDSQYSIVFDDIFNAGSFRHGYNPGTLEFLNGLDVVNDNTFFLETINFDAKPFFENEDGLENYLLNNVDDLNNVRDIAPLDVTTTLGEVILNDLSVNKGLEFNFIGSLEEVTEGTNLKEVGDIEILDNKENKFVITSVENDKEILTRGAPLKLLKEFGKKSTERTKVQLQYLSGYELNDDGNFIMKRPIYRSSSELSSFVGSGREYLFRIKVVQEGRTLPIYNEYFIKKV